MAIPSPAPLEEPFALGVTAGDAYSPAGMAVDAAGRLAVVYARTSAAGGPAIAVVDLARGEVSRLIPLPGKGYPSDGRVLLSPDGRQGYAVDSDAAALTLFDPRTGALGATVYGVTQAALSPDGDRIYAILGRDGLRAFAADDLRGSAASDLRTDSAEPLWSVTDGSYLELAVNGGVLAATRGGVEPALVTFDGASGSQLGSTSLEDVTADLAPGPDGGWLIAFGYNPARLVRLDSGLKVTAETEALDGSDPYYDAPRGRYLIVSWAPDGSGGQLLTSYAADDLAPATVSKGARANLPDVFAPHGDGALLGLRRRGGARLSFLDATDLASTRDVILGVKLTAMALDEAGRRLFVADDQDRIHVLGVPDGKVQAVWDGAAPIALDTANGRLYVNRAGGVVALDATTGEEIVRFPQNGMPAPDPGRDVVYITEEGVTTYDRAGKQIGRLDDTFPVENGMYPNPFAFAARVDPVDGTLVTLINNGTPGSNNRSFLRLYPPQAARPITITGPFTFVTDAVFDPGGDLLVSYSNAFNMEALQRLDRAGHELGRLGGRTGALALDPTTGLLYVAAGGALARVDAGAMRLVDLYRGPEAISQILLHPGLREIYVRSEDSSRLEVLSLDELQPNATRPAAAGLPPEDDIRWLDFLEAGDGLTLFATSLLGDHYRASVASGADEASLRWERLPVGSIPAWGELTVARDVLFRAGAGEYGGDGVFRSRDGGESWELLAAGLTDLRPAQPVLARGADEAYFVGRTGGVLAWRPGTGDAQGKWESILPAERDYQTPGELSLAPDGTLFLASWDRVRRSTDGGRNWRDLPLAGEGVEIAGFDPDYALTRTLFSFLCDSDRCQLLRSRDGGETHQAVLVQPPYSGSLALLARTGRRELYLHSVGSSDSRLFRSLDGGSTWQAADAGVLRDATSIALAPDGRLWLGSIGSVRAIDPDSLSWSAVSVPPPPRVSPSPRPRVSPSPSPTPCAQALPDLGCPLSPQQSAPMARQPFQQGRMVWIGSAPGLAEWERVVIVLSGADTSRGVWRRFADTWQEGQPESDPAIVPPESLRQPVRGFGKVWREQLGGPIASIGWATASEEGRTGSFQPYQGGALLRLGEEQLLLARDGTWRSSRQ
jgi:hypothetical protein